MSPTVQAYDELTLRIHSLDSGYRVLASSPYGEAHCDFELPFESIEVENFTLRMSRGRRGTRRVETSEIARAKDFGKALFDALVRDEVRELYHRSLARSEAEDGAGLRLSLALSGVPELMDLPWEFLYDDPNFLSLSVSTPVVRYLDLPAPRRPLKVEPPLRILAMVSSPSDYDPLDVEHERTKVEQALAKLIDGGLVELVWLEDATLGALRRLLMQGDDFHVFHYIGHAEYDEQAGGGAIVLEGKDGRGKSVPAWQFSQTLHDNRKSLQLAVLNGCEGSLVAPDDPFAGLATSIVQRGIPAVIAMQFAITDAAAIVFAEGFYEALAAGYPVDAALGAARMAILTDGNDVEWATPVLFMRVPDGRIFDIEAGGATEALDPEPEPRPGPPSPHNGAPPPPPPPLPPLPTPPFWRKLGIGVAGLALVALLVYLLLPDTDPPGPGPPATLELGGQSDGVAVGKGSVWVADRNDSVITRVNPTSMKEQGFVDVGTRPDSLAFNFNRGDVWVTIQGENRVDRIDPVKKSVVAEIPVGDEPEGVAVGHGAVWVANKGEDSVTRIDPEAGPVSPQVGKEPIHIAVAEDNVWVTVSGEGLVRELDARTAAPTGRQVRVGVAPRGIAFAEGLLWVAASLADQVVVVDPSEERVVARIKVAANPREVRAGEGAIWVTSADGGVVSKIDPPSRKVVGSVAVEGHPHGLAVGEGFVWATSADAGVLTRIDPDSL